MKNGLLAAFFLLSLEFLTFFPELSFLMIVETNDLNRDSIW